MKLNLLFVFLIPVFISGQTFRGEVNIRGYKYELFLRINKDSSFNFTRIFIPGKKKERKGDYPPHTDSVAYFSWRAKKINDTNTFIAMENTYSISFLKELLPDQSDYWFVGKNQKDSLMLVYDSVRIWLPASFRLIYENGIDTTYSQTALEKNSRHKSYPDTSFYSRLCTIYTFPVNKKHFEKSEYVHFDIGLKHPTSGLPLLFKVPKGYYPIFKNWNANDESFFLVTNGQNYYLKSTAEYFYFDEFNTIGKIEMKKISDQK
ncbi:MAG: hypothetical protein IAF38_21240 [Bacteroidia bacterium]|nr:hypothetical protein [Bacteroidia bacterium]